MVKRKATTSRATSSKIPRISLSNLNILAPAQNVVDVQDAGVATDAARDMPPTPPRAHPKYVAPTPRVSSIPLAHNVTLSLDVRAQDESADFPQTHSLIPIRAVRMTCPSLRLSSSPVQSLDGPFLRPVFNWHEKTSDSATTRSDASDVSTDDEMEAVGDEESDKIFSTVQEPKTCEPLEQVVDGHKTHVAVDSTDGPKKFGYDNQKPTAEESGKKDTKNEEAVVDDFPGEPGVDETSESKEQSAETA
ncbi:hypothetical protein D9619_009119 [Psilocybe cf. subviscida]|uniref:Uncharacterized protein n=1 Tax=Psilocybe cf. subviscida TaxID=2480587 RepID=A0A8H5BUG2_9AGAR|nr:hypothetical protein D9619_009119 [Psilocybe cf. subviscida]